MNESSRILVVDRDFLEDLEHWVKTDRRVALRILELIEAIRRDPFDGIGKPELLRHLGSGIWSRLITQEHRLVYQVTADKILLAQARYQY